MFTSTMTRPLRWAIPLAVLAVIVAAAWFLRPLEIHMAGKAIPCRDIPFDTTFGDPCGLVWRGRLLVAGLILLLGCLPLLIVAVRACVLAADAIAGLREDMRR